MEETEAGGRAPHLGRGGGVVGVGRRGWGGGRGEVGVASTIFLWSPDPFVEG